MADHRLEPEITCPECGRSAEEAVRTDATTTDGGADGKIRPPIDVLTPKSGRAIGISCPNPTY